MDTLLASLKENEVAEALRVIDPPKKPNRPQTVEEPETPEALGGTLAALSAVTRVIRPSDALRETVDLGKELGRIVSGRSVSKRSPKDQRFQDRAWEENFA